jgi:hypothetical protein
MNQDKKKKKSNDTSKSIIDISENFKKTAGLENDIKQLSSLLESSQSENIKLVKLINEYKDKVSHLENMLQNAVPIINSNRIQKFEQLDEETIAELQLQKLKGIAESRDLTLEEARKFEIFSKVKKMAKEGRTTSPILPKLPEGTNKSQLLQIAEMSTFKDINESE